MHGERKRPNMGERENEGTKFFFFLKIYQIQVSIIVYLKVSLESPYSV